MAAVRRCPLLRQLVGVKRKCCERHQFDAPDPQATSVKLKFRGAAVLCYPLSEAQEALDVERREFITLCTMTIAVLTK